MRHNIPIVLTMLFSFREIIAEIHLFYEITRPVSLRQCRTTVETVTSKNINKLRKREKHIMMSTKFNITLHFSAFSLASYPNLLHTTH